MKWDEKLRAGDVNTAETMYRAAAEAEAQALAELSPEKQKTYGVTAVSAVALWYKARS
jgi:hypothetical protein